MGHPARSSSANLRLALKQLDEEMAVAAETVRRLEKRYQHLQRVYRRALKSATANPSVSAGAARSN
jgi:hypothetical protein